MRQYIFCLVSFQFQVRERGRDRCTILSDQGADESLQSECRVSRSNRTPNGGWRPRSLCGTKDDGQIHFG